MEKAISNYTEVCECFHLHMRSESFHPCNVMTGCTLALQVLRSVSVVRYSGIVNQNWALCVFLIRQYSQDVIPSKGAGVRSSVDLLCHNVFCPSVEEI